LNYRRASKSKNRNNSFTLTGNFYSRWIYNWACFS